jgi:surface polysaccharide O-acyltransferase-like enzyme
LTYWFRRIFVQHELEFGHLWFVAHLLVYGLIYALWRKLRGPVPTFQEKAFPGAAMILGYIGLLGFVSAVVRHWFPIDRWVFIGVPSEVAHLPQYLSLFLVGILAHRHRWLERIPDFQGAGWLAAGLLAVAFRYACTIFEWRFCWRPLQWGINWTDLLWNLWEALLCVGLCIGLIWFFRRAMDRQKRFARFLSDNSYGVYLVHLHILVAIQMLLVPTRFGPLTLTAISALGTILLSYFTCWWLRKIPGVNRVI